MDRQLGICEPHNLVAIFIIHIHIHYTYIDWGNVEEPEHSDSRKSPWPHMEEGSKAFPRLEHLYAF